MRCVVLAMCSACAFPATRHAVMDAEHAVQLGTRARVVAINGAPASGTIDLENGRYMFEDASVRREIARTDRVGLDIEYKDGETIPGEGVVSTQPQSAYATAGAISLGAGAPLAIIGLAGAARPPCTPCFGLDFRGAYAFVGVLGAVMMTTGIGFLVAAALTPPRVRRFISMTSGTFTF